MKFAVLVLLVCFLSSGISPLLFPGIDLIAMKKQEDERRKKLAKSKVKVTDSNLNTVSGGNNKYGFVQMESDEGPVEEEAPGSEVAPRKDDVTRQPDFWKKQQIDLEQRIAKLREDIEIAQSDLNRLWSDFYIKNIAAEQEAIRAQIAQLTNQIEQKKLFLSQGETQLEELYEKARKAGVPPGWLR